MAALSPLLWHIYRNVQFSMHWTFCSLRRVFPFQVEKIWKFTIVYFLSTSTIPFRCSVFSVSFKKNCFYKSMIFSVIEWLFCHCLSTDGLKMLRLCLTYSWAQSTYFWTRSPHFVHNCIYLHLYLISFEQILLSRKIIPHINWWFQFICWNSWDFFIFFQFSLWTVVDKLYYELEQSNPFQWISIDFDLMLEIFSHFFYWFKIPKIICAPAQKIPWTLNHWTMEWNLLDEHRL